MPLQALAGYLHRRLVRAGVGLSVLAAAFLVQYQLANITLPVNLSTQAKFKPMTVKLGQEELVIENPVVSPPGGALLVHRGKPNEVVNAHFDRALLDEVTLGDLSGPDFNPPSSPTKIAYTTPEIKQKTAAPPCRTFVSVEPKGRAGPPRSIHLLQLETPGADRRRHVEIKAGGGGLGVRIWTTAPPGGADDSPGCDKLLRIADLPEQPLPASADVTAVVADNSRFRLSFRPMAADAPPLWGDGAEGFYEPFDFGPPQISPDDPPPFQARAVSVRRLQGGSSVPPVLSAESAGGDSLLRVEGLRVGSNELQLLVSGEGMVSENGEKLTVNFWERVQKYPLPAALLGALNVALIAWVARLLFSKRNASGAET